MSDEALSPQAKARLKRVLVTEHENMLGRLAVRRGLITGEQLNEALAEQLASEKLDGDATPLRGGPRPLGAVLVGRRWIQPSDLISLMEEQRREESTRSPKPKASDMPPEARAVEADPQRNLAEFILVSRLGRGGGGEVWKAWDRHLRRWVAVKMTFSQEIGPRVAWERFRHEAMAAARLSHPNIVSIHRVAEHEGNPYIVMELVEGPSLAETRLPLREALEAIRKTAMAVYYAHDQGVIHGDLKPGNLVRDGKGEVRILDFGLARLIGQDSGRLSTGAVYGTPAYMAPEQTRGESGGKDPAVDVYGLGATLYTLATGSLPFPGDLLMEVMRKVRDEEIVFPAPPNPELPKDVEAIILKAMAKDPRRRYATAAEFAEDVRRHLEDEPIAARPASRSHRLYRRVRKNALLLGLAAGAGVAALVGLWHVAEARKEREEALRAVRAVAQSSLEGALKIRRGGGTKEQMKAFLPPLQAAYAGAARRAPGFADGDYLMGRMHRALMEDDKALEFQEKALAKDPRYTPALYERAVLRSKKYQAVCQNTDALGKETTRAGIVDLQPEAARKRLLEEAERIRPDLAELRRGILRDCGDLERALQEGAAIGQANVQVVQGMLAYHQREYARARELLRKAIEKDPLLEEAWRTLAASTQEARDDPEVASQLEALNTQALSRDKGYAPHLVDRSVARFTLGGFRMGHGEDPRPDFSRAEEDLREVLRLDKEYAEAWRTRGIIREHRALYLRDHGQDPLPDFAGAEEDFTEALRLDPAYGDAMWRRGKVRVSRGNYLRDQGRDPLPDYAAAEKDLSQALSLDKTDIAALNGRGYLRMHRGVHRMNQGGDPLNDFTEGEKDFDEALRLARAYGTAWRNRAILRLQRGIHRMSRGGDPTADFGNAEGDLAEAIRWDPTLAESWVQRGHVRLQRARVREGKNDASGAEKDYAAAAADYREALRLNPALERQIGEALKSAEAKK